MRFYTFLRFCLNCSIMPNLAKFCPIFHGFITKSITFYYQKYYQKRYQKTHPNDALLLICRYAAKQY